MKTRVIQVGRSNMICSELDEKRLVCALNGEVGLYKRSDVMTYETMHVAPSRVVERGKEYMDYYRDFMTKEERKKFNELREKMSEVAESMEPQEVAKEEVVDRLNKLEQKTNKMEERIQEIQKKLKKQQ